MEKRLLLFLVLTFVIIFVWQKFVLPQRPLPKDGGTAQGTGSEPSGGTQDPGGTRPPVEPGEKPAPEAADGWPKRVYPVEAAEEGGQPTEPGAQFEVDGRRVRWTLDSWGGSIRTARLKEFTEMPGQDPDEPENWYRVLSEWTSGSRYVEEAARRDLRGLRSVTLLVIGEDGRVAHDLSRVLWDQVSATSERVVYRLAVPGAVFEKEYIFNSGGEDGVGGYDLEVVVRLVSGGESGWRLRLVGPANLPVDVRSTRGRQAIGAGLLRSMSSAEEFTPSDETEVYPDKEDQGLDDAVRWVGVHGRFFGAILEPAEPTRIRAVQSIFTPVFDHDGKEKMMNVAAAIDFELGGKVGLDAAFRFYAGPMDPRAFAEAPYEAFEPIIDYGLFEGIAKILLTLLRWIQAVVVNWGIAIIVLTLLVRLAMFPLSRKQQVSMRKHQRQLGRIKPKMDALKEKHKDNRKKMNEEMMKLYREEKVQMLPAGCLVIFLQMPIFIGLFQALWYSIDLRHSAFLWASDLTAADCLIGPFTHTIPLIWKPFCLNLFPILMGITWYISSAMQPKPADPQQAQTMKMMKFMPIVFTLMLYNYAAGMALYMIVSSTWAIFELKVIKKYFVGEDDAPVVASASFRKGR